MAANYVGYPVGSAVAGGLAAVSLEWPILLGIGSCLVAGVLAAALVPARASPA